MPSKLLTFAVRAYRANPFRPHCGNGHHVLLCRLFSAKVKAGDWDWDCPELP